MPTFAAHSKLCPGPEILACNKPLQYNTMVTQIVTSCSVRDITNHKQNASRSSPTSQSRFNGVPPSKKQPDVHRWQNDPSIVGALEIPSEHFFNYRSRYTEIPVDKAQKEFKECLELWHTLDFKKSFIEACDSIPPCTIFCGMVPNHNKTIYKTVEMLKKGWERDVNKILKTEGIKISCLAFTGPNKVRSRAQRPVLLIRFHSLSFRRLSRIRDEPQNVGRIVEDAILAFRRVQDEINNASATSYDDHGSNSSFF